MQRISAHQNCTLVHLVLSDWWKFSSCRAWKLFLFFSFLKFFKSRFIEVVNPSFCIPLKYSWLVRLLCSLAALFGGCELLGWLLYSWLSCFRQVFFTAISFFFTVSDGLELRPKYNGILHCMTTVWKHEGLRGLYQGVTPNMLGAGASWGLYFFL